MSGVVVLVAVLMLALLAVLALLLPLFVYRIKQNTDAMRRDLRRLADEAQTALSEPRR